jgi:hypothetical protein
LELAEGANALEAAQDAADTINPQNSFERMPAYHRYWCRFSSPIFETRDSISGLKIVCRVSIRAD